MSGLTQAGHPGPARQNRLSANRQADSSTPEVNLKRDRFEVGSACKLRIVRSCSTAVRINSGHDLGLDALILGRYSSGQRQQALSRVVKLIDQRQHDR